MYFICFFFLEEGVCSLSPIMFDFWESGNNLKGLKFDFFLKKWRYLQNCFELGEFEILLDRLCLCMFCKG